MALACTQEEIDVLTMGSSEVKVPYEGVEKTLEFTASTAWTIESDQDWVSFDQTEGVAGDVTVVMTVAANTTYENRTAVVTISAGDKFTEITLQQGFASEFATNMEVNLNFKSQVFEIELSTNLEYEVKLSEGAETWITSDALTKAAPVAKTLEFNVSMNTGEARTAVIYITAENFSQTVLVKQGPIEPIDLTSVEATFLGQTSFIYDEEAYAYKEFDEYYLEFANEEGDKLTLSLNAPMNNVATSIPEGVYTAGSVAHEVGTFTITDGTAKYYASAVVAGLPVTVVDGSVAVTANKIVADIVDESGLSYSFAFAGKITDIEDKSFGASIKPTFGGQYTTYFTTKANAWHINFIVSKQAPGSEVFFRYFNVTFYTAPDVTKPELPVGTFTFADPQKDENLSYKEGILLAEPGMMTECGGNDNLYENVDAREGSVLTISKNDDGTYNFALNLKLQYYSWDAGDYVGDVKTWEAEFKNVTIGDVSQTSLDPMPDGDAIFKEIMSTQYGALWFGDKWETGGSAFVIMLPSVNFNYTIQLVLNQDKSYTYEKNFLNRFCNTPFEDGTYAFSKTPSKGEKSLIPAVYGTSKSCYCYVQNGYTGTIMPITGGYVKLENGTIVYNLETTVDGKTYKFTGEHGATLQYAQDWSARIGSLGIVE